MSELTPLAALKFPVPLAPARIEGARGDLKWIELNNLFIDRTYQREVANSGRANIRRIVENFAWHLFSPLIVAPRENGRFAVIDGQHRAIAAKLHGSIGSLPCLVLHCSREDEARAFAVINGNVTKVTAQYLFRARLAAGEQSAIGSNRAAQNAGVRILLTSASAHEVKFNETQAPSTIEACFKTYGEKVLTAALSLIVRGSKGYRGCIRGGSIIAFCDVLRDNPRWLTRLDEAVAALASYGLLKLVNECMAKDPNDTGVRGGMRFAIQQRVTTMLREALGEGCFLSVPEPPKQKPAAPAPVVKRVPPPTPPAPTATVIPLRGGKVDVVAYLTKKGLIVARDGEGYREGRERYSKAGILTIVNRYRRASELPDLSLADIV